MISMRVRFVAKEWAPPKRVLQAHMGIHHWFTFFAQNGCGHAGIHPSTNPWWTQFFLHFLALWHETPSHMNGFSFDVGKCVVALVK